MAKYRITPSSKAIIQLPISIGHKAEKGVEAIEFDLTAWVETYGSGTLTVIMRRWGDAIPYPIALEIDENNKATWTLSDTDTAKAGMAYAQLSYIVGDEVVKKSDIYTFRVMDSLTGEGEPPEAYESWLEHLTHFAAEAMAEVLDIEGVATDKTLTVDGGIADGKATGDALALKADKSTTYTKTEVDQMIEDVEVETDTTLEIAGAPADAAETGRQIGLIKADLGDVNECITNYNEYALGIYDAIGNATYTDGYYIADDGTLTPLANHHYTSLIPVETGKTYTLYVTGGDTSNPLRVHGYNDSGVWQNMIVKQTMGGSSDSGLKAISVTIPDGVTQIRISCRINKILKAFFLSNYETVDTRLSVLDSDLEKKADKIIQSNIDFTTNTNGYIKDDLTVTESGNWKHITLQNVRKGTIVKTTTYGNSNLYAIFLVDGRGIFIEGVKPSSSGAEERTLICSQAGTVYINYSSSYDASGTTTYVNNFDQMRDDISALQESANIPYMTMLHKIGVLGDSLSSGEIYSNSTPKDCYNYSWLSNIGRDLGLEIVHYSKGGLTSKSWWNDTGGYKTALAGESTKPNAYYIAFGTNDKNQQEYPIGNISDIAGTDSFVGYMRSIIEYVHTEQPNAVIFLVTTYNTSQASIPYNEMIEDIADLYSYCFFVDYANNGEVQTTQSSIFVENSHFSTLGYVYVANIIKELTEQSIRSNLAFYKHFGFDNYSV